MKTVPHVILIVTLLALSVVVSPVSAARLPANSDLNMSPAPTAWLSPQSSGWPPASGCYTYYQVQWGNTLSGIAAYYHTTVWALMAANPSIWNPNVIYACQVLCIPYPTYAPYPAPYPVYSTHPAPYPMYSPNPAPVPY